MGESPANRTLPGTWPYGLSFSRLIFPHGSILIYSCSTLTPSQIPRILVRLHLLQIVTPFFPRFPLLRQPISPLHLEHDELLLASRPGFENDDKNGCKKPYEISPYDLIVD